MLPLVVLHHLHLARIQLWGPTVPPPIPLPSLSMLGLGPASPCMPYLRQSHGPKVSLWVYKEAGSGLQVGG